MTVHTAPPEPPEDRRELTEDPPEDPGTPGNDDGQAAELFDAPADVDSELATGYAVYDRTLGRYVTGVTKDKPSAANARKAVREGHTHKIVRV